MVIDQLVLLYMPHSPTLNTSFQIRGFARQSQGDVQLVRGILQLLEEWEYHFALTGVAHQSVKAILAKNIDDPSRASSRESGETGDKTADQVSE